MFEKEVNKNMYLGINSSRLVFSWYFQEEFERPKKEKEEEELRQWKEDERRWKEYMSAQWKEEEEEEEDNPWYWKCNLIW